MKIKCLFCGNIPEDKNKEHILPQWLLRLTGDPSREVPIVFDYEKGDVRRFNFNKLTVPSCSKCNTWYGDELESKVSPVVESIAKYENIDSQNIDLLLDWLDKVRIGLWYAQLYFLPKEYQFEKQLWVGNRIGKADRSLIIYPYRSFKEPIGLTITGTNNIAFIVMPSAFGLRINKVILLNISTDFLIGRRLGHYFPKKIEFNSKINKLSVGNITRRDKVENSPFRVPIIDNPHVFSQVCYSKDFYDTFLLNLKVNGINYCERTGTYKSSIYYSYNDNTSEILKPHNIELDFQNNSYNTNNYEKLALIFDLYIYILKNLKGYNGTSLLIKELMAQKKAMLKL